MAPDPIQNFAKARGLRRAEGEVPAATPALAGRAPEPLLEGEIAPGLHGRLIRLPPAERDPETLAVLTKVPETLAFAPALICRDRRTLDATPASIPAERWEEVRLESHAFDERFRLLALAGQDHGWLRELFSPALISYLAHDAAPGLSWELNSGDLVVLLPGGGAVERLAGEAAELARRIRAEAEEEGADPDLFDESEELADLERALATVEFTEPPASAGEAVDRFREVAARKPSVLLRALTWAAVAAAPVIVGVSLLAGWFAALIAAGFVAAGAFWLGRLMAASRYRWGGIIVSRAGLEAFVREYARSRGFELLDRWAFHAEHRKIPFPGFADHVLFGRHRQLDRDVHFVLLADAGDLRSRGMEVAYTAERPYASNALLVRLDEEVPERRLRDLDLPEGYRVETAGADVLVWKEIPGNLARTAAGSDRFLAAAGAVIAELLGEVSQPPPARQRSTGPSSRSASP